MNFKFIEKVYLKYATLFIAGVFFGVILSLVYAEYFQKSKQPPNISLREHDIKYKFIAPLLASADDKNQSNQYGQLKDNMKSYFEKNLSKGEYASVYFRDLNKGQWIGINEEASYYPASLLKVVVMIAYFKKSELEPSLLEQQFEYRSHFKDAISQIPFEDPSKLVVGQSYSVNDLIHKMIVNSDNGAMAVLVDHLNDKFLNEVYTNLQLQSPNGKDPYTISAKAYSLFFRILYNSTYINRELSEKALGILGAVHFNEGLVAGVPKDTSVAHKYGEYVIGSNYKINNIELHDCGIVYLPGNPYFLCVMTHTPTLEKDQEIIKSISALTHSFITNQKEP